MYDENYLNPLELGRLYVRCQPYLTYDYSQGVPPKTAFIPDTPQEIMDAWEECQKYAENIKLFTQETGEYIR